MKTVAQLLAAKTGAAKTSDIWTIDATQPVLDAIKCMAEKNIGALLVTDGQKLTGIISERDYARKVILRGKSSRETLVSEIMSDNVISVAPDDTIDTCMSLMTKYNIRHLPVLERGKITGVLSIGDLVRATIAEQQQTIEHLEGYIMS